MKSETVAVLAWIAAAIVCLVVLGVMIESAYRGR